MCNCNCKGKAFHRTRFNTFLNISATDALSVVASFQQSGGTTIADSLWHFGTGCRCLNRSNSISNRSLADAAAAAADAELDADTVDAQLDADDTAADPLENNWLNY